MYKIDNMKDLKFYTVKEVAEIFRVSESTIRLWFRQGKIAGTKTSPRSPIRFSEQDIENFHKSIQTEN